MTIEWESELAALLNELMTVQDELLELLAQKRQLLVNMDLERLAQLEPSAERLMAKLQACHDRRGELLAIAASESRPAESLRVLAKSLPRPRSRVEKHVDEATQRARLLQHQSFANWFFVQRSLIHLTRMLEIIATGGKPEPTYGRGENLRCGGSLVDQAA